MQKYNDFFRHTKVLDIGLSKRNPKIQSNYFKSTIFVSKLHEYKNLDNMNNIQTDNNEHFITDTDFVKPYFWEQKDIYNIVYGPLFLASIDDIAIYNMVISICKSLGTKIWKRIRVRQYIECISSILKKLKEVKDMYDNVVVSIPFLSYEYSLDKTIHIYTQSISVLNELLDSDFVELELLDLEGNMELYPIPSMENLFEELRDWIGEGSLEGYDYMDEYIVTDEMHRRGLHVNVNRSPDFDKEIYREVFIGEKLNFSQKESLQIKDNDEGNLPLTAQNRIGVLYYMLNGKIDTDLLIKVGNFILNKDYDIKKRANNAVYNYIHKPNGFTGKIDKVKYIISQLERYEIAVPKELEKYRK